jgi:predicted DNA-binding antitoxin AbrB/MazE fold protein
MVQILAATFKDGAFKPHRRPALLDGARVRLVVETIDGDESSLRQRSEESWATLQHLWNTSNFYCGGDRLSRDRLHQRS